MPIFIANKTILNYAKHMREKIVFLSILLSLPLRTYGYITIHCPDDSTQCDSTPGCKYTTLSGCTRCDNGEYCPGDGSIKSCTDLPGSFPKSPKGSTDVSDCYKPTSNPDNGGCEESDGTLNTQCGLFYPNSIPKCWNNNGEYSTDYHTEPSGGEICYANTRNCDKFRTPIGCDGGTVTGTALWLPGEDNEWYINGNTYYCQCEQSNVDYHDAHCTATTITRPTSSNPTSANASITYGNVSSYYCTQCPAGYYVHIENGFLPTANCPGGNAVCVCDIVDAGHYSQGCGPFSNNITNNSFCPYQDCPYGQTSPEGATQITDCHYTGQTQFCDSKGCFTLGNDAQNWHALY